MVDFVCVYVCRKSSIDHSVSRSVERSHTKSLSKAQHTGALHASTPHSCSSAPSPLTLIEDGGARDLLVEPPKRGALPGELHCRCHAGQVLLHGRSPVCVRVYVWIVTTNDSQMVNAGKAKRPEPPTNHPSHRWSGGGSSTSSSGAAMSTGVSPSAQRMAFSIPQLGSHPRACATSEQNRLRCLHVIRGSLVCEYAEIEASPEP